MPAAGLCCVFPIIFRTPHRVTKTFTHIPVVFVILQFFYSLQLPVHMVLQLLFRLTRVIPVRTIANAHAANLSSCSSFSLAALAQDDSPIHDAFFPVVLDDVGDDIVDMVHDAVEQDRYLDPEVSDSLNKDEAVLDIADPLLGVVFNVDPPRRPLEYVSDDESDFFGYSDDDEEEEDEDDGKFFVDGDDGNDDDLLLGVAYVDPPRRPLEYVSDDESDFFGYSDDDEEEEEDDDGKFFVDGDDGNDDDLLLGVAYVDPPRRPLEYVSDDESDFFGYSDDDEEEEEDAGEFFADGDDGDEQQIVVDLNDGMHDHGDGVEVEPFVLCALFHERRVRQPVVEVEPYVLCALFGEPRVPQPVVVEVEPYVLCALFHERRVPLPVVEVEPFVLCALFHERRVPLPVVEMDFEGVLPALFGEPVVRVLPIHTVDALDVGAAFRSMFREEPLRRSRRLQAKARIDYSGMC